MKFRSFQYVIVVGLLYAFLILTSAQAQTNFTMLRSFTNNPDGIGSFGGLVLDPNGVIYGTAVEGGTSNQGVVFAMNSDGSGYHILHNFVSSTDGEEPFGALALGSDTNLYGVTLGGSVSNAGTVFRLNRDGSGFMVLHSFTNGDDGERPEAGLLAASDGALYGTTSTGSLVRGTVFKINKDGTGYQILHSFTGEPDGQEPTCKLLEGSDGALYGTAQAGGTFTGGTVFKLNKDGSGYETLYDFDFPNDGFLPSAGVIEGSDGVLYGTAYYGGGSEFEGTIFKINTDGTGYQILYSFPTTGDGLERPDGELLEGSDGALYGAAAGTVTAYYGGIFKINKDGTGYTALRLFGAVPDGSSPQCALLELNNIFCGTTEAGGTQGFGCVFALSASPLLPRIVSLSASSKSSVLQFAATSTTMYDVERSTNLINWPTLTTFTSPVSSQTNYTDLNPPQPAAFYRLHQH